MAALPAGVLYGLSSESSYKENKELVFVKLTDSALKAIEDFIRNNRDKLAKPKIQFLPGNEGKISIPAASSGNGSPAEATFHFSINSNAEMEGPQGSFECVRSASGGPRRLETCGPLPRRMRVQANDDSYEATKDRMAKTIAADQSKCTRVIKPNQTDIGRRVKVRSSHSLFNSGPSSVDRREREPDRREPDRRELDRVERPVPVPKPVPQMTLSQSLPKLPSDVQRQPPSNPDLTRRSIKERLIQLLALKPFKKPELYARLNSEGIKEKERSVVNKILPQIGTLKDNCYHLRRHIWNDVNEDWPFYSEEEKRMLKRRKPQNLTPPLSSDSANSLSPRASPSASKRAGSGSGTDELPSKKQRISHYRRPSPPSSGYATTSSGERHASDNEDDRTTNVKKDNGYTLNFTTVKEICPSPPVKTNGYRNSPPVEQKGNGYKGSPPREQPKANGYRNSPPTEQPKANGYRSSPPVDSKANVYRNSPPVEPKTNGFRNSPPVEQKANGYRSSPPVDSKANVYRSPARDEPKANGLRSPKYEEQTSITVNDITHNTEPLESTDLAFVSVTASSVDENMTDMEEIERQYPPITSSSTRRAYKNEFAELYSEYRAMYARVAQVAARFTQLEQQLKRAEPKSPHQKSIEQRIVEEYRRVRHDPTYQNERRRVNYLHRKLTHIKRMVQNYDNLSALCSFEDQRTRESCMGLEFLASEIKKIKEALPNFLKQARPDLIKQERPPLIKQERPPLIKQERPPLIKQERPPLIKQEDLKRNLKTERVSAASTTQAY